MSPSTKPIRISAAAPERATSPAGVIGAVLLHAGIIVATFFTLSHRLDIADQSQPVVPVDLVTIGEKTNIAPTVQEQPKTEPKDQDQPPSPQPDVQQAAPAPSQDAAPPDDAPSEPKLATPPPPIVPKLKPRPEQKSEKFDINNIMALLDKRAPAAAPPPNAKVSNRTNKGFGAQNAMTADLRAMLQSMIYKCWSPPVGALRSDDLVVTFEVTLNPDGTVASAASPSTSRDNPNAYNYAAGTAAERAIYTCQPYKLPADEYIQWRDVKLRFDPRDMMGQ